MSFAPYTDGKSICRTVMFNGLPRRRPASRRLLRKLKPGCFFWKFQNSRVALLRPATLLSLRAAPWKNLRSVPVKISDFPKAGHTPSLIAAFLYFDVSFMAWVLLGPLGPFDAETYKLSAT